MTDNERFELLWRHYHAQIDENRAVSRSINDIRNNSINIKDLSDKINKYAYVVGIITATLVRLKLEDHMQVSGVEIIDDLLARLTDFVETEIHGFSE